MIDFNVLALAEHLSDEELELVVSSFSELYHRVTFKHHKRMKLKIVCGVERAEGILGAARVHNVSSNVELVPNNEFDSNDWSALEASVLFLPTARRVGKVTRTALAQGIPMVAFQNESISEYVDQSCGMLVRNQSKSQNKDAFSRILNMLFFDPEVRKLLKKGAAKKYMDISGLNSPASPYREMRNYSQASGF